ncbi:polysaccharide pyruvyl transferase family protein [Culturomica massiliensis]|jgi:hypothetical protein|uniref:polysaccharide pyruvyl transferase family protein n=1 Tax=Culturomica massiliensis TaxID=1841857 RepID=UPI0008380DEF|nr:MULTISPECIES: polysaccharide pyruvyl transferase family protein [Odoribacteraceae]RHV96590.1 polysaccharide pyruvyl transferase family protein [Odoribacter sp. OF09-27XD]
MKIGILTFHFGNNYGGLLQCYALQEVLKRAGYEVEIINYRPGSFSFCRRVCNKIKSINSWKVLAGLFREYFLSCLRSGHSQKNKDVEDILTEFDLFREKYLHLSSPVTEQNIGEWCAQRYDAIVVGSDQVWTSLYEKKYIYFLDWKPEFPGKRISYAACSAHEYVRKKQADLLSVLLGKFDYLSVRDMTTARLIKQITGKEPDIVPDPTLIYDFKEFVTDIPVQPYILTYILGSEITGGHEEALKRIKGKYGCLKVISVHLPQGKNDIRFYADENHYTISPEKWVDLFAHASFVYTDSFHGIMFAVKFHIPFVAYYANLIRASRLLDLKERCSVSNIINRTADITEANMKAVEFDDLKVDFDKLLKVD